jgi:hypothetical protein
MVGRAWEEDLWACGQQNARLWCSCWFGNWMKKMGWAPIVSHLHNNSLVVGPCPHLPLDT